MTTTAILSAVSAGTSTNIGDRFNPVETALQATTTAVLISVQITRGASMNENRKIRVRHAVSPNNYASALIGALALAQASEYVDVEISGQHGTLISERASDVLVTAAGYHYCWVEMPKLPVACTITVNLQELP